MGSMGVMHEYATCYSFNNFKCVPLKMIRLQRNILQMSCAALEPQLRLQTKLSNPPHLQVLTTISFLAAVTFQKEFADRSDMSQTAV